MAFAVAFFAVETEGVEDRLVVHREEQRLFPLRPVDVLVPAPQRRDEAIPLFPVKRLAVDHGGAAAAEDVVYRRARVAVDLGALAGTPV
jgi:hypothetical protein